MIGTTIAVGNCLFGRKDVTDECNFLLAHGLFLGRRPAHSGTKGNLNNNNIKV